MTANLQRALILFEQGRLDQVERELGQAIAAEPDNPSAHAMLALCLGQAERFAEATREAEEAVRLAPDLAYAHFALASVLNGRGQNDRALAAVEASIRLDPQDADAFALLASIRLEQRRWRAALQAADQGLQVDPEHSDCANLRAVALTSLGDRAAAAATVEGALARDPENAATHTTQGWALLHRGEYDRALDHFREALRLSPMLDWAREGLVEALKARYLVYGLLLRYFLWMSRLSRKAQFGAIIGGLIGYRLLRGAAQANPSLAPWITPLLLAYGGFVVLTWVADPLFNLLLRLNRYGRYALSPEQVVATNWVGGMLAAAGLSALAAAVTGRPTALFATLVFGALVLPLAGTFRCRPGWPRRVMAVFTALLAFVGLAAFGLSVGRPSGQLPPASLGRAADVALLVIFLTGVFVSAWVANGLAMVRPKR